jgi:glycosyltransferase, group 2 family protein
MSISVIINTYNSARHLEKVIDSVKDFDEIIVCDMESTDDTVDIARRKGAHVITFPKGNHTCCEPARNFAIEHASSDWVFVVDADELVPHALRRYLYRYTTGKNPADGLYIPRRNYILDRFRSAKYPDYQMRFFRADVVEWPPYVHSNPKIDGTVSKIPSNKRELALIHIPHSIDVQIRRLDAYTTAEVEKDPDRKISLLGLTLKPLGQFLSSYVLKGGFRYGIPGFIAASHDAVYLFYREAKIYESQVKSKMPTEIPEETTAILGEDEEIEAARKNLR